MLVELGNRGPPDGVEAGAFPNREVGLAGAAVSAGLDCAGCPKRELPPAPALGPVLSVVAGFAPNIDVDEGSAGFAAPKEMYLLSEVGQQREIVKRMVELSQVLAVR